MPWLESELNSAVADDKAAKAEAMQKGLAATQPLTQCRLQELCELGEKMMRAEIRKNDAVNASKVPTRARHWGWATVSLAAPAPGPANHVQSHEVDCK